MTKLGLALVTALTLGTTGVGVATSAPTTARSGCSLVSDPSNDTAAEAGAAATLPYSDPSLDLTGVDVASNARWVGARVRLAQFDKTPPAAGGESFSVFMTVNGGTLIMGVGRYSDLTGVIGDDTFAYAGFQRGTPGPRNVPARAVQLNIDPFTRTASVFVDRAALKDIGATLSGSLSNVRANSGRQYGGQLTIDFDHATGPATYRLGAPSCLRLPS